MTNYATQPATLFHPDVEVRVSKRRKKTAGAHWEGDRIVVVVPVHLRGAERDEMVEALSRRMMRHRPLLHTSDDELAQRARLLGQRYLDGVEPSSIRWSTNQNKRWGSCTIQTREIRISERLRVAPDWVLDAVIVHELAHLFEHHHNAALPPAGEPVPEAPRGRPVPRRLRPRSAHARRRRGRGPRGRRRCRRRGHRPADVRRRGRRLLSGDRTAPTCRFVFPLKST